MNAIVSYILMVISGAILAAIVRQLAGSGTMGALVKYLAGLFVAVTILSPLADLRLPDMETWLDSFRADGIAAAACGEKAANEVLRERIKAGVETYILDKAAACGADTRVEVYLDEAGVPVGVTLRGNFAPAVKARLAQLIRTELGIGEEAQDWTD